MELEIIAEAGSNHNGSVSLACDLVEIAAHSHASSVKFQFIEPAGLYKQVIATEGETIVNPAFAQRQKEQLTFEEWKVVWDYAKAKNIPISASVFCQKSLSMLGELGSPYVKISSSDALNFSLIRSASQTFNRVIVSSGMTKFSDIAMLLEAWHGLETSSSIDIMHCVSNYPCNLKDSCVSFVKSLSVFSDIHVGYSDHTSNHDSALLSLALGATFFEKHFTSDKSLPGFDHKYALNPLELTDYITTLRHAQQSLSAPLYVRPDFKTAIRARRGVYATKHLIKGQILSPSDFVFVRPSTDFMPFDVDSLVGMQLIEDIPADSPISQDTHLTRSNSSNSSSAINYWSDEMRDKKIL